jgi:two-component SAPR family response regulator
MTVSDVKGCRFLVVEDEILIAVLIEDALVGMGCEIVGPTGRLDTAMQLANEGEFDAAILDITIRGGKAYPIAELLVARGIPFAFASGYSDWALPEAFRDQPRLIKPFTPRALDEQIRALCVEVTKGRRKDAS